MMADYVFWPAIAFMAGCSLYYWARIKGDRMAMQWGFDGKPTWSAPKAIGAWGTVALALFTRFLIWAAMTYFPQSVHNAESGLLMASIIFAVSHLIVLTAAARASDT
ncbi:MAG: hypothetical protein JWP25_5727 [Bradyrhizobium sp.]|jgi:hypothetical protein|nr:hypothetical protein [Bradyrhizobium sp.]MEA2867876.1 hypothetical protein [Bradyrhizobium sp.]